VVYMLFLQAIWEMVYVNWLVITHIEVRRVSYVRQIFQNYILVWISCGLHGVSPRCSEDGTFYVTWLVITQLKV
jgi:hypothetical protein